MAMKYPWENLKYVSKIEVTAPPTRKGGVIASLEEDTQYEMWHDSSLRQPMIIGANRRLRLTDEVVTFHWDYPDDFKKLVKVCGGHHDQAYEIYQALQKPVPADWDAKPETDWDDCECC